jgi:hypothetical protein
MSSFFYQVFTINGAPVKTDNSEKNLSQCHFVHHKSNMDLARNRTRAFVVRGRRLTAWAMALPSAKDFVSPSVEISVFSLLSLYFPQLLYSVINSYVLGLYNMLVKYFFLSFHYYKYLYIFKFLFGF